MRGARRSFSRTALALAVLVAHVTCLCSSMPEKEQPEVAGSTTPVHRCHGKVKQPPSTPPASAPSEPDQEGHQCQHCQGGLASRADGAKIQLPQAHTSGPMPDQAECYVSDVTLSAISHSLEAHAESPPSLAPPTLLRLHCALTT